MSAEGSPGSGRRRQRGWAGALTLLIALLAVALLAVVVVRQYVLPKPAAKTARDDAAGATVGTTQPAPFNALERARSVEGSLRQQAEDADKRIDAATR